MKKIICLIMVILLGLTIIPKTIENEHHMVLENEVTVYTKEEVDNMLLTLSSDIAVNTNEITNIKNELTEVQNNLKDYVSKETLNTTNSNIDSLNSIVANNTSRIEALENNSEENNRYYLYNEGNEYTDITGGWAEHIGANNSQNALTGWLTKNTDHMIATVKATGSYYQNYTTNNKIDLTGYELVGIEYSLSSTNTNPASAGTGMSSYIAYTKSLTGVNSSGDSNLPYYWKTNATRLVDTDNRVVQYYQIDTTSTIKDGYLTLSPAGYYANTTTKIYKIWLQ